MHIKFPYLKKHTESGILLTPYCWLPVLTHQKVWRKHKFLFDTGADYTSVPKFMSDTIGVNLACLKKEIMYTANNDSMMVYFGSMQIWFDTKEISLPCVFTDRNDTPFLLGRAGLIDRFEILLSAKNKSLSFK